MSVKPARASPVSRTDLPPGSTGTLSKVFPQEIQININRFLSSVYLGLNNKKVHYLNKDLLGEASFDSVPVRKEEDDIVLLTSAVDVNLMKACQGTNGTNMELSGVWSTPST